MEDEVSTLNAELKNAEKKLHISNGNVNDLVGELKGRGDDLKEKEEELDTLIRKIKEKQSQDEKTASKELKSRDENITQILARLEAGGKTVK